MAQNPYVNKVIYAGNTLIDLTEDTITKKTLIGIDKQAFDKTGELITGSDLEALVYVKGHRARLRLPDSVATVEGTTLVFQEAE